MVLEGITQLIGGISAKNQHNKYAKLLAQQEMTMPSGITDAETILKNNSNQGLAGYEQYVNDIESLVPNTVNAAREVVETPSQLLDAVMKSHASAENKIRDLGITDANAKLQNEVAYANFLSGTKAPVEMQIEDFKRERDIGVMKEKMSGSQELWKGIGGFANTLDSATLAAASLGGGNILKGFTGMFGGAGQGTTNTGSVPSFSFTPYTNPWSNNPGGSTWLPYGSGDIFSQMLAGNQLTKNPFN